LRRSKDIQRGVCSKGGCTNVRSDTLLQTAL
jgi:hypothetical protein